jgi:hypothetical protein
MFITWTDYGKFILNPSVDLRYPSAALLNVERNIHNFFALQKLPPRAVSMDLCRQKQKIQRLCHNIVSAWESESVRENTQIWRNSEILDPDIFFMFSKVLLIGLSKE